MPHFQYLAKSAAGENVGGVLEAPDQREALNKLHASGLTPLQMAEVVPRQQRQPAAGGETYGFLEWLKLLAFGPTFGGVTLQAKSAFFRQFGAALHAGMTQFEALSLIANKTADPKLRRILESGATAAQNGEPFSATMSRNPAVFPPHQIAIIQASEQAGRMEAACEALSRHLETEIGVRREMRMATLYPKIAMAISLLLISIIANAPLIAKALSSGTYGTDKLLLFWLLMRVFVIIGGALLFFFFAFKLMLQNPSLRLSYDALKLALPVFGPLLKSAEFMLFGRSLAALLRSGVEVGTALEVSAATVSNWHFRQSLAASVQLVRSGRPLSDALEPTGLFNGLAIGMIRTGERAGTLDEAIEQTCEYLEGESRSRMKNAAVWVYVFALMTYLLVAGYFVIKFWTGMAGGLTNITE